MRSQVRGIILIDSPCPARHVPMTSTLIDAVLTSQTSEPRSSYSAIANRRKDFQKFVKSQFARNVKLLEQYGAVFEDLKGGDLDRSSYPPVVLLRSKEGFCPRDVPHGDVPEWLKYRTGPRADIEEWRRLIRHDKIEVLEIPGDHFSVFKEENVSIASCLP